MGRSFWEFCWLNKSSRNNHLLVKPQCERLMCQNHCFQSSHVSETSKTEVHVSIFAVVFHSCRQCQNKIKRMELDSRVCHFIKHCSPRVVQLFNGRKVVLFLYLPLDFKFLQSTLFLSVPQDWFPPTLVYTLMFLILPSTSL